MTKTFDTPFAENGDLQAIPNAAQPDGTVSYSQGFGPDYAEDQLSNPNALDIPRPETNQLFNDVTGALKQYQTDGVYDYDALLKPYNLYSHVRFNDGFGVQVYESRVANNNDLPSDPASWRVTSSQYSVTPASIQQSQFIYGVNSSSANALVTSILPAYGTLAPGMVRKVKVIAANTGAVTLDGAAVGVMTPLGLLPCVGGELQPGIFDFTYVDVGDIKWMLINPACPRVLYAQVSFNAATSQSAPTGNTRINYNNVLYDPYNWWDNSNKRFIPNLPGKFELTCKTFAFSQNSSQALYLYVDGTFVEFFGGTSNSGVSDEIPTGQSGAYYADGTNTFFQVFFHNESSSNTIIGARNGTNGDKSLFQIKYIGN